MNALSKRSPPIPTLYVKDAPGTYYISAVFSFARQMSPCLLVLEDIETIVNPGTRSYFFNEVDGLENNDGILMTASTNYIDRLDPGLTKRPSRFDRKYLFPLPSEDERTLYAEFWREKLKKNPKIVFPKKLCCPIARVTEDFSFAYMQEAFIATLLEMARRGSDELAEVMKGFTLDNDDDDLDDYLLWRVFKEQAKILRDDMGEGDDSIDTSSPTWSRRIDSSASQPKMPGAFKDDSCILRPRKEPAVFKRDDQDEQQAYAFLSRYEKWPLRNPAADEYRSYNNSLVWAKRS